MTCPWKIHWGVGQESTTQCESSDPGHLKVPIMHAGRHPNPAAEGGITRIEWAAGDRREYTGDWPGPCDKTAGCILHLGHRGRCAL